MAKYPSVKRLLPFIFILFSYSSFALAETTILDINGDRIALNNQHHGTQNIYYINCSPIISYYIHILNCCIYMMNKYQTIGIFLHVTIGKYEIYPTALRCIWNYTCLLLSFSRISSTGITILERSEYSDICGCIALQRQQMLQNRSKHIFKGQISCQSICRQALFNL